MFRWVVLFALLALPTHGEEVVAGLSQNRVAISTNFDGSEILIFGAIKRDSPAFDAPTEVIVTVEGPSKSVMVHRMARRFGIWVNSDKVEVDKAPSFYAVATSAPWSDVITDEEDLRYRVSINRAIRSVGATIEGSENFTQALIRIRQSTDAYQSLIGAVDITEQTLFRTAIQLPANLIEGDYRARFLLTRDGVIVDSDEQIIAVQKVGLERFLYRLAYDQPLIYGLMSLAIAIAAGWGASAVFSWLRP